MQNKFSKAAAGTFILNKNESIHRWYSYLEGYSSCLIEKTINDIGISNVEAIYDPFCGAGTTVLVAAHHGIPSYYSETNPFMRLVIESKINCVKRLREFNIGSTYLRQLLENIDKMDFEKNKKNATWNGFEKYFDPDVLNRVLSLKEEVNTISNQDSKKIVKTLLASVIVQCSKMKRQGDLRFAKENEKSDQDQDVVSNFKKKIKEAIDDIEGNSYPIFANTECISEDSRDAEGEDIVNCVITSPPYLNGTNYIRNTKLELKLCDYIVSEKDLPALHSRGIIAGINNVSKRNSNFEIPTCVIQYVNKLKPVAYDKRIPIMVAGYFHDMEQVIIRLSHIIKNDGYFVMDIGDSQFAGVHIPTHEILTGICKKYGFVLCQEEILRERHSKNGMVLSQRLLKFRLHKRQNSQYMKKAKKFVENMPYRNSPYAGRNWGHPWHSLCSYHGKLKPAIAHFMIKEFTSPGDVVLDPLCGVGTIPFEACLQDRIGIGNDLSELAYIVTKAKLEKPKLEACKVVINKLKCFIENNFNQPFINEDIKKYELFGFNGKLQSYFHPDTYREILCARRFFVPLIKGITGAEAMVYSCFLHVLHGNRPYALSRRSHPLTPYAPKGDFVYKNVVEHITDKLNLTYNKGTFENYRQGKALYGDYNLLSKDDIKVDEIICSPPFADSIKFYMQNWMRLWLCGWENEDYKQAKTVFLDQRQRKDFDVYNSFFEMCASVLKPNGKVILHLGKTNKVDMAEELSKRAQKWFSEVYRGFENVQSIEKHGIKDKGRTIEHEFLFLERV